MPFATTPEIVSNLRRKLAPEPWFAGAALVGVGADAVIEIRTLSLQDAGAFIDAIGGRWNGHPVKPRRA